MPKRTAPPVDDTELLDHLEMLDIATLYPHPRNDGQHPPDEIAHLRQSIREHNIYRNIVVAQDGTILAGHGVVLAAQAEGRTHVPGYRMPYTADDPRALKLLVGDNHIARLRLQDDAALVALLEDLARDDPLALLGTGFDAATLEALAQQQGLEAGGGSGDAVRDVEPQIDRAEALRQEWGTEIGQLWACGEHRVFCGDCTDSVVIERLLPSKHVDCCLADPPYNISFDYTSITDALDAATYQDFTLQWFGHAQARSPKQIVTPGCNNLASWLVWFPAFYVAPWIKTNAMTHGYVSRFFCWEPILFYGGEWFAGNEKLWPRLRANDVFNYPVSAQAMTSGESLTPLHPCPKPLALWVELLEGYTDSAASIYDPFLGSGTTLIACTNLQRRCYGCEIDPGYMAVTLQRYFELTGERPQRLT